MTRFAQPLLAALIGFGTAFGGAKAALAADLGVYIDRFGRLRPILGVGQDQPAAFAIRCVNVPNLPNVRITDFQGIHERRYLPAEEDHPIGRRYCGATVILSDGQGRDIWYLIEEGQGFASIGNNVEFCVSGFDRWYVYNGACRVLR